MERDTKHAPSDDISLIVRSDWSVGPRTAAWERLWQTMLGSLDARPIRDAREHLGREGLDA
jgi:hypothetical protein